MWDEMVVVVSDGGEREWWGFGRGRIVIRGVVYVESGIVVLF